MTEECKYSCREYREEMTLLGLKKQLNNTGLSDDERRKIKEEINKLELSMGME
jgi:ribosome recycling factor